LPAMVALSVAAAVAAAIGVCCATTLEGETPELTAVVAMVVS